MKKRIAILILLIIHSVSQSGMVVFAFNCSHYKHTHYSINKQTSCKDFKDRHCSKKKCCDCASHSNTANILLNCCDNQTNLTFSLGIDIDKLAVNNFSFSADVSSLPISILLNLEQDNNSDYFSLLCKRLNFKYKEHSKHLFLVSYIHSITSSKSDDFHIC